MSAAAALELMATIAGGEAKGFIEVRHRQPGGGMHQEFFDVRDHKGAAAFALRAGTGVDTYVGMAPRTRRGGKSEDVDLAWLVSADCDTDESLLALESFDPRPSVVIASGGMTGSGARKLHAHWRLTDPADRPTLEAAKRALVAALGSDSNVTDAARIMRVPNARPAHERAAPSPSLVAQDSVEVSGKHSHLRTAGGSSTASRTRAGALCSCSQREPASSWSGTDISPSSAPRDPPQQ